ncbi:MAG: beta-glucosidase [Dactylosporangium sp.]|nr:beta-glucosidase [Dactylosporangium sp.]
MSRFRLAWPLALVLAAGTLAGITSATNAQAADAPYQDPTLPVSTRVDDLLARMSLAEKAGQMTQAERSVVSPADLTTYGIGSVLSGGGSAPATNTATGWADMVDTFQRAALATPLGIPMLYGVDAVHGDNNVYGSTIFPHNIGLGATRNPTLVQDIGRAVAEEVTGAGPRWTFAPCLAVARNDRWGRTYESFGETPDLVSSMADIVTGFQGPTLGGAASVLATAKHYIGDGATTDGVDQGDAQITEEELRAIHLPPFQAAVNRGVGSIMVSFSSVNGVKMHGNTYLITDVLKGELGFAGFVVSDWAGIDQLDGLPGFTQAEVAAAVNAGIDMIMVPYEYGSFITALTDAVTAGQISMARVDDAVSRILAKKFELGLFEEPLTDRSYTATVGGTAHRDLARQAVRESQVLLKNEGDVLPLAKSGGKVFVAGKSADDIGNASGGWTISWQGDSGNITPGTTILEGIRNTVGSATTVTYSEDGTGIDSSYRAAIAVVGETPYAEGVGDLPGSMGLDTTDLATIARLRAAGVPVIVVLVSGRPMDIAAHLGDWDAFVAAWLPGTEGQGVADVLFGDYNPTGTLPMTWMASASQQPINDGDGQTGLFPYGYGLSYPGIEPSASASASASASGSASASASAGSTCTVTYQVTSQWSTGFIGEVAIVVTGGPVSGWTLTFAFPGSQQVTSAWSAVVTQSGTAVTATNAAWNGTIAAGGSASFGFQGTYDGTNTAPTAFALNGTACALG